jgi:hypothetical protein
MKINERPILIPLCVAIGLMLIAVFCVSRGRPDLAFFAFLDALVMAALAAHETNERNLL